MATILVLDVSIKGDICKTFSITAQTVYKQFFQDSDEKADAFKCN